MVKKIFFTGNGCSRRYLDASRIKSYFEANGCVSVDSPSDADLIFLTTCSYKKSKVDECIENVVKYESYPGEVFVYGCLPGIALERLKGVFHGKYLVTKDLGRIDEYFPDFKVKIKDIPDANYVLLEKRGFKELIGTFFSRFKPNMDFFKSCKNFISRSALDEDTKNLRILRIANGCLGKCSYCAIKFSTGYIKSKPLSVCVDEYKKILEEGCRHIVIDAEDVGAYGADIGSSLDELFTSLSSVDGGYDVVWSIWTMSPDWAIKYQDVLKNLVSAGKLTRIKVDVQSGSERVLELMNRYPDLASVKSFFKHVREVNPNVRFHSQFIVGFPSETEEEFQMTISFIEEMKFDTLEISGYSSMNGTPASTLEGQISDETIMYRVKYMQNYLRKNGYKTRMQRHYMSAEKRR
ncbi:MAG: radical SAM protein [Candidatus Altiarchaeota archaeon]|nr:radical SAM protein [Candidatus Altiarchaeota archaeon]